MPFDSMYVSIWAGLCYQGCYQGRMEGPRTAPCHTQGSRRPAAWLLYSPDYRNGGFTTTARLCSPRTSTSTAAPGAAAGSLRYAGAMPLFREGDLVPLVTSPTSRPPASTAHPWR